MKPRFSISNLLLLTALIATVLGWYLDRTQLSQKYQVNTALLTSIFKDDASDGQRQLTLISQSLPVLPTNIHIADKTPLAGHINNVNGNLVRLRKSVETQQSRLEDVKSGIR